jgi:hypothetical protein
MPVDWNRARCIDTDLDLVATYINDHDGDVISDHNFFVPLSAENKHVTSMSCYA